MRKTAFDMGLGLFKLFFRFLFDNEDSFVDSLSSFSFCFLAGITVKQQQGSKGVKKFAVCFLKDRDLFAFWRFWVTDLTRDFLKDGSVCNTRIYNWVSLSDRDVTLAYSAN